MIRVSHMSDNMSGMPSDMRFEAIVPASVANLGPGFDSIGMAVDLFQLRLSLVPGGEARLVTFEGTDAERVEAGPDNLITRALEAAFRCAGQDVPSGFRLYIENDIPIARGLGSSAAAIVGGLLLAREWLAVLGASISVDQLVELAVDLEGHGDNVVAAMMGGVTLAVMGEDRCLWQQIGAAEYPALVLAVPESWQTTDDARRLLPAEVPYADAVFNSAHAALLVTALVNCRYDLLAEAMRDRLHEPYREQIYPWISPAREAALAAGAYGVSLSGAGPSMVAFVPSDTETIRAVMRRMEEAYLEGGLRAGVYLAGVAGGAVSRTVSGDAGDCTPWTGVDQSSGMPAGRLKGGGVMDVEIKA